jgi:pyrroloquinoline quinone biosynthesis protein B
MRGILLALLPLLFFACSQPLTGDEGSAENVQESVESNGQEQLQPFPSAFQPRRTGVELTVLGVSQDAGYPQIRCRKSCCQKAWGRPQKQHVVSLGLIDNASGDRWLFEATPDMPRQIRQLDENWGEKTDADFLQGIFLTHAHIGHYTGLMHLGREAMGAHGIRVYAMPRMAQFLSSNGPWSQLLKLENILLAPLEADQKLHLRDSISVVPLLVPHRDEFSETVGFRIEGPEKAALFIPDIDKWEKWNRNLVTELGTVDYAFLDATFFSNGEIPGRDMSEIPHPFVEETMALLQGLPETERAKVYFIHFNHTNPLLDPENDVARKQVESAGFHLAREGMTFPL